MFCLVEPDPTGSIPQVNPLVTNEMMFIHGRKVPPQPPKSSSMAEELAGRSFACTPLGLNPEPLFLRSQDTNYGLNHQNFLVYSK